MEHVEEPTSKYAAKQRRYSNGVLTESVTLTDVVESMAVSYTHLRAHET